MSSPCTHNTPMFGTAKAKREPQTLVLPRPAAVPHCPRPALHRRRPRGPRTRARAPALASAHPVLATAVPQLGRHLRHLAPAPEPRAPIPRLARASRSGEGEPEAREKRSALPIFGDKTSASRSPSTRRPSATSHRTAPTPSPPSFLTVSATVIMCIHRWHLISSSNLCRVVACRSIGSSSIR